jgi:hypothetical protein
MRTCAPVVWRRRCVLAAMAASTLALLPGAAAASSFTWSGGAVSSNWSVASNWEGGAAPASNSTIEALEFPRLANAECTAIEPALTCYVSHNNLSGLTVNSMQVDDGEEYLIFGEGITLGNGGLSAAPTSETSELTLAAVFLPITLAGSQTWNVAGVSGGGLKNIGKNQIYLGEGIKGASDALTVNLGEGGGLDLGGENEVGAVSIDGAKAGAAGFENGIFGLFGGHLNSVDGNAVNVNDVYFYGAGRVGALTSTDAELEVPVVGEAGKREGTLSAASATFDPASKLRFEIVGSGATPGNDNSELVSPGAVGLGGASLYVYVGKPAGQACPSPAPGTTYTLLATTGSLSGTFGNAPEGFEMPIEFEGCPQRTEMLRIAYHTSGATKTVTGTVVAGATSRTALTGLSSDPVTNQQVTLVATVSASEGSPSGKVDFENGGVTITGCGSRPVTFDGQSYSATCETAFAASSSPQRLSATFTPEFGENLQGSASEVYDVAVGRGATTTTLAVSNATPSTGVRVVYTATTTAVMDGANKPTGPVEFLDGGAPIGACASEMLAQGNTWAQPVVATCEVSYSSAGGHSVTARYGGDGNFTGSSSSPATTVTVHAESQSSGGGSGSGGSGGGGSSGGDGSSGVGGVTQEGGGVSLVSANITVQGGAVALVKLHCTALEGCRGKLSLGIAQGGKRAEIARASLLILGTGHFSASSGATVTIRLKLDAKGRALLRAGRGRLSAELRLAEIESGREQTQTEPVRVLVAKPGRSKRRKK